MQLSDAGQFVGLGAQGVEVEGPEDEREGQFLDRIDGHWRGGGEQGRAAGAGSPGGRPGRGGRPGCRPPGPARGAAGGATLQRPNPTARKRRAKA